jgi:DNA-binding transcriptional LysR family regulator
MTIRHLKIFVAVCEAGSMTKAGQTLFMAQPTISQAIRELEIHYRAKLFDRIAKRLYLTDAGKRLLPYAQQISSIYDAMEADAQGWDSNGVLRIGASITIGTCLLPDLLTSFATSRPDVTVQIQIDNSEKIKQAVLENAIDIGLIEGLPNSSFLVSESFYDDELVLLCSAKHRWAGLKSVAPEDLKTEPFLMREKGSGGREILESAFLLQNIELEPTWESISTQAILQAVSKGLGVAILPLLLAKNHIQQGLLLSVPIDGIYLKRKFAIIYHKSKYLSSSAKEFIQVCHSS